MPRLRSSGDLPDDSHDNLPLEILRLFGDERATFGTPEYCTGPLGTLT